MFIRLKKRKLAQRTPLSSEVYSLYAVLVETQKEEEGPRQQILGYLGSIRENDVEDPQHQERFLKQVKKKLVVLKIHPATRGTLLELLRENLQSMLSHVVPTEDTNQKPG